LKSDGKIKKLQQGHLLLVKNRPGVGLAEYLLLSQPRLEHWSFLVPENQSN